MVLSGCNSANLIDGLDGLLSGVTGIALIGQLIGIVLLPEAGGDSVSSTVLGGGPNLVLAVVGLGDILDFLPHNFNPANIFLGDAGEFDVGLFGGVHHFDVGRPWSNPCGLGGFDGVYLTDLGHLHGNCSPQTVRQAHGRS